MYQLEKVAEANFPTEFGRFRIHGFEARSGAKMEEAIALVMGELASPEPLLVRIHSQCLTGDVFHSLRCDCRDQLELSLQKIGFEGRGMIIYEMKEGRGIGLLNKLRAYELQDAGADTVEANENLGFEADLRDYSVPARILRHFGVARVRLLSNNPDKVKALETAGIEVSERVPCVILRRDDSEFYLRAKKEKLGHIFEF